MGYDMSRLSHCLLLLRAGCVLAIPETQSPSLPLCNLYFSEYTKNYIPLPFSIGFVFLNFRLLQYKLSQFHSVRAMLCG